MPWLGDSIFSDCKESNKSECRRRGGVCSELLDQHKRFNIRQIYIVEMCVLIKLNSYLDRLHISLSTEHIIFTTLYIINFHCLLYTYWSKLNIINLASKNSDHIKTYYLSRHCRFSLLLKPHFCNQEPR